MPAEFYAGIAVPRSVITMQFCALISIISVCRFYSQIVVVMKAQLESPLFKVSYTGKPSCGTAAQRALAYQV